MISLSNLLKQQYVIHLGNEARIINADEKYKPAKNKPTFGGVILPEGITGSSIPTSEEIIDGFLAGLDAEEIQLEPVITPEEIIEQARAEAEGILSVAKANAAEITAEAERHAELLYEQKKQQAYQEGISKSQDEIQEHKEKLQEEYNQLKRGLLKRIEEFEADYEAKVDALENDMVDVMIRVFHKVFNVQFDNKKQILLHLIKDTLLGVDAGKSFIVRVAESNYKFIESHVADIKEKIGNDVNIDVVNDMNLQENDCIIETATGVYNCGIDTVLSNLEKDIKSLCR